MDRFFLRLDRIDAQLESSRPSEWNYVMMASLIQEPASAEYLVRRSVTERPDAALGTSLLRTADLLAIRDPGEGEIARDILQTEAVRQLTRDPTSDLSDMPVPTSRRQIGFLVDGLLSRDEHERVSEALAALLVGLDRQKEPTGFDPRRVGELIRRVAASGGFSHAVSLLVPLGFSSVHRDQSRRRAWELEEILDSSLEELCEQHTRPAFRFFLDVLNRSLTEDSSLDETSTIWRPKIEHAEHPTSVDLVLDAVRVAGQEWLRTWPDESDALLNRLWASEWKLDQRLALWLASRAPDISVGFVEEVVFEVVAQDVPHFLEVEFADFLERRSEQLGEAAHGAVRSWIRRGPDLSGVPEGTPQSDIDSAVKSWKRDWLALLDTGRDSEVSRELASLREAVGPERRERWERGVRTGWVRQLSPIPSDEMREWSRESLPARLLESVEEAAEGGYTEDFTQVSTEGLVGAVADAILDGREWWLEEWQRVWMRGATAGEVLLAATERLLRSDVRALDSEQLGHLIGQAVRAEGLSQSGLRSLAEIARLALDGDWPEVTPPDSLTNQVARLVGQAARLDSSETDDPSVASLNSPDGIASNVACVVHLKLKRRDVLDNAALATSRGTLQTILALERPATHATLGRWFSHLLALDAEWAVDARERVFPIGNEALFQAAWSAYVRYGRLAPENYEALQLEYEHAVSQLDAADTSHHEQRSNNEENVRSLTEHLVVLAAWGELTLDDTGLLNRFFSTAPLSARRHAHSFLAHQASDSDLGDQPRERMQHLLEWRINAGASDELDPIGWWAEAPVSDEWLVQVLQKGIRRVINIDNRRGVIRRLSALTPELAASSLSLLRDTCEQADRWELLEWSDKVIDVLETSLQTTSRQPVATEVADLADHLGALGLIELRDVYRRASELAAPADGNEDP